ncbi:hypothetical protein [Paenibacillus puerhi]|uniref:hypothetical protein n=1 Tax=Paenibacillus puerhi TaxID=2692622 RepID=UPI00135C1420|nr:hypothetical protein [Paenibacillus puerhi]
MQTSAWGEARRVTGWYASEYPADGHQVRIGSLDRTQGGEAVQLVGVTIHEEWQ